MWALVDILGRLTEHRNDLSLISVPPELRIKTDTVPRKVAMHNSANMAASLQHKVMFVLIGDLVTKGQFQ